jgi:hypothetical protein
MLYIVPPALLFSKLPFRMMLAEEDPTVREAFPDPLTLDFDRALGGA